MESCSFIWQTVFDTEISNVENVLGKQVNTFIVDSRNITWYEILHVIAFFFVDTKKDSIIYT